MAFTPVTPIRPSAARATLTTTSFCPFTRRVASTPTSRPRGVTMLQGKTIKETLVEMRVYSTLIQLAEVGGVDLDVSNCTVFPPTDTAFARKQPGFVHNLMQDPAAARAVVLRHILPGSVLTSKQIRGSGFWENILGGPLGYQAVGPQIKIGNIPIINETCDNECIGGTIHPINGVISTPLYKPQGVAEYYFPDPPSVPALSGQEQRRALGAASSPSTVGARKAMGLIKQMPFWMYGPPFNAAKQEDFEPISIAQPDVAFVDYSRMPLGSVVVVPDEVEGAKLNPVSGYSKYFGQTKKCVEGDALSDYSRLD